MLPIVVILPLPTDDDEDDAQVPVYRHLRIGTMTKKMIMMETNKKLQNHQSPSMDVSYILLCLSSSSWCYYWKTMIRLFVVNKIILMMMLPWLFADDDDDDATTSWQHIVCSYCMCGSQVYFLFVFMKRDKIL